MSNNSVEFDLNLAVQGFDKNLGKVDKNLKSFHSDFKKQANKSRDAWSSFAGNLGAVAFTSVLKGIGNVIGGLKDLGSEAIKNAAIQEEAINDLNIALKSTGTFTDKASQDFQDYASALQQSSTFGDEAILKTAALGAQMAKLSGQELKDATLAAANMASALGVDLDTAMRLIAKSATDGGSGLKRYGIEVEAGVNKAESLANAVEAVNNQFGGAAAGKVDTYSGALKQASNSYGDMLENVGQIVTESPAFISIIKGMNDIWVSLGKTISANKVFFQELIAEGLVKVVEGFEDVLVSINPVIAVSKSLWYTFKIVFNAITAGISTIALAFTGLAFGIVSDMTNLLEAFPASLVPDGWLESMQETKESLSETVDELTNNIVTDADDMAAAIKETGRVFSEDFISKDTIKIVKDKSKELKDNILKSNKEMVKSNKDKNKKIDEDNTTAANKTLVDTGINFSKLLQLNVDHSKKRGENFKSTTTAIAGLATSENKTLGAIGKAAAIANITMDTIQGVMKAWALGPILGPILAPLVGIAGATAAGKIAGVNFQHGGIVPGSSFSGDNVSANVNSGEMILNRGQQAKLFSQVNNGSGSSTGMIEAINNLGNRIQNMEIKLVADDNEIAKSASRGFDSGIVIGGNS